MNDQDLRRLIEPDNGLTADRHAHLKEQLMATILTNEPDTAPAADLVSSARPRRTKILIAATAATLAVAGAAAAATGNLFPDDSRLLPVEICRAESSITEAVASMVRPNGNTITLYTTRTSSDAPINGDALVETTPDGQTVSGTSGCNSPGLAQHKGDEFWLSYDGDIGAETEIFWPYGKAPAPATSVEIDFDRGETITVAVEPNGYFVGEFTRPGTGEISGGHGSYDPKPTTIRAFDSEGNLIAEQET